MIVVLCSHKDCLSHGIDVCMANRILLSGGKCSGYIDSRNGMRANAPPRHAEIRMVK
jgi:aminoglycoside phosphotransferase